MQIQSRARVRRIEIIDECLDSRENTANLHSTMDGKAQYRTRATS
jgi:predicted component of type VI protein secretion system